MLQTITAEDRSLTYLVPERIVRSDGFGHHVDIFPGQGKLLHITLRIDCVAQQEALVVSISGSQDGNEWTEHPLLTFSPKYYCGTYSKSLNLARFPGIRYLRAEWKLRRAGNTERPMEFAFYVFAEESGSCLSSAVA